MSIPSQGQGYSVKSLGMASEQEVKMRSKVKNYWRDGRLSRVKLDRD